MRRKRETLLEMPRHVPLDAVHFGLIPALLRSEKGSDGCRMFEVVGARSVAVSFVCDPLPHVSPFRCASWGTISEETGATCFAWGFG